MTKKLESIFTPKYIELADKFMYSLYKLHNSNGTDTEEITSNIYNVINLILQRQWGIDSFYLSISIEYNSVHISISRLEPPNTYNYIGTISLSGIEEYIATSDINFINSMYLVKSYINYAISKCSD